MAKLLNCYALIIKSKQLLFDLLILHMSEKMSENVSEKILRLIRQNIKTTIAELAREIGVSTRTIERHLKKLQDQNRLERLGSAKSGTWHVMEREE